ncbi:hypothetical protein DNTS_027922 [Danionella cerebrum]|uniref:Secretory calcium-binding phosphoprotein 5 n=1 Tax=Danionella cerebrum TaxID=2873325 RepID=A0A553PZ08_9TELE|nr:hypothetical protein DNTS_027922 [Danionella translucida]
MWTSFMCLLLAGAVSSAPGNNAGFPGQPHPAMNAPVSMEIIFPQRIPGNPAGGAAGSPSFPTQAFIKYSLPKAPGRKSVEIFYPYDFGRNQDQPNLPVIPQLPNIFPFDLMPQTVPQQPPVNPPFQDAPPQPQEQQPEKQAQTGQVVFKEEKSAACLMHYIVFRNIKVNMS